MSSLAEYVSRLRQLTPKWGVEEWGRARWVDVGKMLQWELSDNAHPEFLLQFCKDLLVHPSESGAALEWAGRQLEYDQLKDLTQHWLGLDPSLHQAQTKSVLLSLGVNRLDVELCQHVLDCPSVGLVEHDWLRVAFGEINLNGHANLSGQSHHFFSLIRIVLTHPLLPQSTKSVLDFLEVVLHLLCAAPNSAPVVEDVVSVYIQHSGPDKRRELIGGLMFTASSLKREDILKVLFTHPGVPPEERVNYPIDVLLRSLVHNKDLIRVALMHCQPEELKKTLTQELTKGNYWLAEHLIVHLSDRDVVSCFLESSLQTIHSKAPRLSALLSREHMKWMLDGEQTDGRRGKKI